jgi:uncharacterized lipoprotein YddW (UPF0748 family)
MKKIISIIFLIAFSFCLAQVERETRAVWLTTNHRLDWPPTTYNAEKQKQSLIDILDDIKSKNLNTVYFQVRMNGTVLFKSSFEPLSSYITGEVDGNASYDPLQFAIEQAHKRGLEIHAWINVNLVYASTEQGILKNPNHLSQKKPGWLVEDTRDGQKSIWMDPGLPEARNYISDLITEMVENYDVDGVHLDYLRYPGKDFNDDLSYKLYGGNLSRDDYRRNNIDMLVEEIGKKVKSVSQFIKLGAAPIGVYKRLKGMKAWESYFDIYQDSYGWLKKGLVDYLTPQIYWGIDENPRFDVLAKDWAANAGGRNVVLGIGAYKENVKPEIDEMIKLSRAIHSSGVAFFRYQNIKELNFPLFRYKAFPSAMPWLDGVFPAAPQNLAYTFEKEKNIYSLYWQVEQNSDEKDSTNYVAVYNLPQKKSGTLTEFLFDVVPVHRNHLSLVIDKPKKVNYFFTLKSVNKIWNESVDASNVISINVPLMKSIADLGFENDKPILIKDSNSEATIIFTSSVNQSLELFGGKGNSFSLIKTELAAPGKNIVSVITNLKNYDSFKIIFEKDKKEVELKL